MPERLPPVEKLPLATRKNVRDEWESKKEEEEQKLSGILGTPWTFEADPNAVYAYATSDYAKNTGTLLYEYFSNAVSRLSNFADTYGDEGKNEINKIVSKHILTIDFDEAGANTYCGVDVQDGRLRILFAKDNLGTNIWDALEPRKIEKALNNAEPYEGASMSYTARRSIREYWEPEKDELTKKVQTVLANDKITLEPNFEAVFEQLKGAKLSNDDWEGNLGSYAKYYFEGFISQLQYKKFHEDDMLQEGFAEAVDKNQITFRVVDKTKATYNESVIDEGVLYLQTTPNYWGTNCGDIGSNVMDLL